MASSSHMSIHSESVQKLLQCAVCLELFKQPKILPCQHTFCLTPCLEGLFDQRTRSIRCPECRADHFVPRAGVTAFPNNLTIIGFLELSKTHQRHSADSDQPDRRQLQDVVTDDDSMGQSLFQLSDDRDVNLVEERRPPEGVGCYQCQNLTLRLSRCCHCDHIVCDQCKQTHLDQVSIYIHVL